MMKNPIFPTLAPVVIAACLALCPGASAGDELPPNALRIDPAARNVLSTGLAQRSPEVQPYTANFMLLWANTSGKNSETMKWSLLAPADGEYAVEALVKARSGRLNLRANDAPVSSFTVKAPGWDRVKLGTVLLAEGENILELEIPAGNPVSISTLEIVRPEIAGKNLADAMAMRRTPDWFKDAGHGLMFQWTNRATPPAGDIKPWNQKVDDFNLDHLFRLVDQSGASFVIWSVTWGEQYISAPIQSLERILPGRTTKRDLLAELADGLESRGVRLIFYYHYGYDCYHSKDPVWMEASGGYLPDKTKLFGNIEGVLAELGDRYGDKLDGWFLDGGHRYYDTRFDGSPSAGPSTAPFRKLALAARKGNDGRVLCFNSWILPRLTEYQDYFAGEGQLLHDGLEQGVFKDGSQKGLMAFGCFTLESKWGRTDKNIPIAPPRYSAEDLIQKITHARKNRYPIAINLEMYEDGSVGPQSAALLNQIRAAVQK